jgi:hypothetical protein
MRKPDLIIGPRNNPQTTRWHLFTWRGWQLSLHRWHRSDDDRALHDHKADNVSISLTGRFREVLFHPTCDYPRGDRVYTLAVRWPLIPYFRKAETPHRVELIDGPVWTLWLRWPARRRWGYWCSFGWRDADEYNNSRDYYADGVSEVGQGCG